jgi:hypothetical protein
MIAVVVNINQLLLGQTDAYLVFFGESVMLMRPLVCCSWNLSGCSQCCTSWGATRRLVWLIELKTHLSIPHHFPKIEIILVRITMTVIQAGRQSQTILLQRPR